MWGAVSGSVTLFIAIVGVVILVLRYRNERAGEDLVQWVVTGERGDGGLAIVILPLGDVRDVRLHVEILDGIINQPPIARAEWPTDKRRLRLDFELPALSDLAGDVLIRIIYRPNERPRLRFEEWVPVLADGRATRALEDQDRRGPLRELWLRLRRASVGPGPRDVRIRRVTRAVERREMRRASRPVR